MTVSYGWATTMVLFRREVLIQKAELRERFCNAVITEGLRDFHADTVNRNRSAMPMMLL